MKFLPFVLLFSACCTVGSAQTDESTAVINVIKQLFDGMRANDSVRIKAISHPEAQLRTTTVDREGKPRMVSESFSRFISSVGKPSPKMLDERIWSYDVRIDQNLAAVWTEYTFYVGDQMSHCGVNAFQLMKTTEGWKIIGITDTRRKDNCITTAPDSQKEIVEVIDAWHLAAAKADEDQFFGAMSADGVFLGTDASERWQREAMRKDMQKAFDKESAWDFKAKNRSIAVSPDGRYAWWDELLDTWMGVCRGSGVLERSGVEWKIKQYNLALMVPNDKIKKVMKLIK
ncbi:nuclear transport factor 2 family protein [Haliscomenobacter sp.]|uniref:nuclear transport factor 2 family protein n=1 Tax=Haliscomenobacter sp. TaxID=2717303 RepID=UPI00359420D0